MGNLPSKWGSRGYRFFCPLCGNAQGTNTIKRMGPRSYLQIALVTVVFSILTWGHIWSQRPNFLHIFLVCF